MKPFLAKLQIGKNGLTSQLTETPISARKNNQQVRISVLKSVAPNKDKMKAFVEEMQSKVPYKCKYRIIGFTIVIFKLSSKKQDL